jgi:hypothetical protein
LTAEASRTIERIASPIESEVYDARAASPASGSV